MTSVTIDAGVLAVPSVGTSRDDAHRYVETLLDWRKLLDEPWVAIYMSERASDSLIKDGLYPLRDHLRLLFATHGIVEYTINDVAQVVGRLLKITPSFETYFRIRDVLADDLAAVPDVLQLCTGDALRSDLARCIVLIAILRGHCCQPVADHSLILRHAPQSIVNVKAVVQLLEHERDDLGGFPLLPEIFEGDVLVCNDFRGLIECLDEAAILLNATDDIGVETAIRIATYKYRLKQGTVPEWDDVPDHRVGHAFRSSLQGIRPTQQLASRLLRAIVETLEKINMAATHWLRTGSGGNDPQLVRASDQAKAWRRDIDREHHLHYWNCDDYALEIASVSFPHDDLSIPE